MKKIKNFKQFEAVYEASIFSKGKELIKKVGSWLSNLLSAQENNEIPIRSKKYVPPAQVEGSVYNDEIPSEMIGDYSQTSKPTAVVKVHMPEGIQGKYKFSRSDVKFQEIGDFDIRESEEPKWRTAQRTQDTQVIDVEKGELERELAYHFRNPEKGRSLCIWGAPGIGKTSVVKQFGKQLGVPVIEVILSLMEPTDVAGLPGVGQDAKDPSVKRSVNFLPMIWPLDNGDIEIQKEDGSKEIIPGKGGIIFLDEVNRSHPAVQNVMLKVVLDREIASAGYKLPSKWLILAAANRPEDEPGKIKPMGLAFSNRFAHVNYVLDPKTWAGWARGEKDLSDDVITFVELMQDYFYMLPAQIVSSADQETMIGITPRAWEYAAREFGERKEDAKAAGSDISKEETYVIFSKHIGKKAANVITDFLETTKYWQPSKISRIFTSPNDPDLDVPRLANRKIDFAKAYAVMYMASKYKNGQNLDAKEFTNLLEYLVKIDSGEIAMSTLNMIKKIHPEVKGYLADSSLESKITPFVNKYKGFMREV
jgi:hypothetical protein